MGGLPPGADDHCSSLGGGSPDPYAGTFQGAERGHDARQQLHRALPGSRSSTLSPTRSAFPSNRCTAVLLPRCLVDFSFPLYYGFTILAICFQ